MFSESPDSNSIHWKPTMNHAAPPILETNAPTLTLALSGGAVVAIVIGGGSSRVSKRAASVAVDGAGAVHIGKGR